MDQQERLQKIGAAGPSIEWLALFRTVYEDVKSGRTRSLRRIGERCGTTAPALTRALRRLEESLGAGRAEGKIKLFERDRRTGIKGFTREGDELYASSIDILQRHAELTRSFSGATSPSEIRLATTNVITVHLLSRSIQQFLARFAPDVRPTLSILEADFVDILKSVANRAVEFGVGPWLDRDKWPHGIRLKPLNELNRPYCCVCPPADSLTSRRQVSLDDLRRKVVYALHAGLQPGLELPEPIADFRLGGRDSRLSSYTAILSFVRAGLGVGVIPHWEWALDDLVATGEIIALPLRGLPELKLAFYFRTGEEKLPGITGDLVQAIQENARSLDSRRHLRKKWVAEPFPADIRDYRYGYYVSCTKHGSPQWRRCKYEWTHSSRGNLRGKECSSGTVTGKGIDKRSGMQYTLAGQLDSRLLYVIAQSMGDASDRGDIYVAAFTTVAKRSDVTVLVGRWVGRGDDDNGVSGPFLLSATQDLNQDAATDIASIMQPRTLLNAHTGDSSD